MRKQRIEGPIKPRHYMFKSSIRARSSNEEIDVQKYMANTCQKSSPPVNCGNWRPVCLKEGAKRYTVVSLIGQGLDERRHASRRREVHG